MNSEILECAAYDCNFTRWSAVDLCLITETNLVQAMAYVKSCDVEIIEGPVERTGATGKLLSFYIRDPDQNLIEIANILSP